MFCKLVENPAVCMLIAVILVLCASSVSHAQPENRVISGVAEDDSPFLTDPATPEELMDAALQSVRLARPALAREYLKQLLESALDQDTLLRLRDRHGPAEFLRLSRIRSLRPYSSTLLFQVNEAFRAIGVDAARIRFLVTSLQGSISQQRDALFGLQSVGAAAIPHLLSMLRAGGDAGERAAIMDAISQIGDPVVMPLLGALDTRSPDLQTYVLAVLGAVDTRITIPWLLFFAWDPAQPPAIRDAARTAVARRRSIRPGQLPASGIVEELTAAARTCLAGEFPLPVGLDGTVGVWSWDTDQRILGESRVSPADAALHVGTRLARYAVILAPERPKNQALYLTFLLARAAREAGSASAIPIGPGTAHDLAMIAGADVVSQSLQIARDLRQTGAARGAIQVLGVNGGGHDLHRSGGALFDALDDPDRRVRFAAANAILNLDSDRDIPRADRIVRILQQALNDSGDQSCLVIDPNNSRLQTMAGLFEEIGFATQMALTGRDGFRLAVERSDIVLVAIYVNTVRWNLSQTIGNLRDDPRTRLLPLVIYGPQDSEPELSTLLHRTENVRFMLETSTPEMLRKQLGDFADSAEASPLSDAERAEQRQVASFWFAHIARRRWTERFDIGPAEADLAAAAGEPALAASCLTALAAIPTASAQERLHARALTLTNPVEVRELATLELVRHVQEFGLMLVDEHQQQTIAAAAAEESPALASALAAVVGLLQPGDTIVSERLRAFPVPPRPVGRPAD